MNPVYLDYNATTPIDPAVADAMRPFLDGGFGNPSSSHVFGRAARAAVEDARHSVAAMLGCHPDEVVFTSGGSEANNHAIFGCVRARGGAGHVITTRIEHPAVSEVCRVLAEEGCDITWLPVDGAGRVDPDDLRRAIRADTRLVTIMHANNEVGTIQPIAECAAIAREYDVPFHSDAAQTVGKIPVDVDTLGVDLLSVAAHKFYGPKGVGALYVRTGTPLERFIHGAGHEGGRRAGTENVLLIAGLGAAAERVVRERDGDARHMRELRDRLHDGIRGVFPEVRLNGHSEERLPNTLSLAFPGMAAPDLMAAMPDVAVSAGAACHGDGTVTSATLTAMDVPTDLARGTIRFSTGRLTRAAEVDAAVAALGQALARLAAPPQ